MSEPAEDEELIGLAMHEAGHAIVADALGFDVRSIELRGEESSTFLNAVVGCSGETESGASDVTPDTDDIVLRAHSAAVAMAGREARRLRFPKADSEWHHLDLDDRSKALRLLRHERTRNQLMSAPDDPADEALLVVAVGEARQILLHKRSVLDELAAALVRLGCPSRMTAADILAIIQRS